MIRAASLNFNGSTQQRLPSVLSVDATRLDETEYLPFTIEHTDVIYQRRDAVEWIRFNTGSGICRVYGASGPDVELYFGMISTKG